MGWEFFASEFNSALIKLQSDLEGRFLLLIASFVSNNGVLQVGYGPPKILVGWATMHLALPIIGLYLVCSLILAKKIVKLMLTEVKILRLKCTEFALGLRPRSRWGTLHKFPAGGALQRSPDPVAVFKRPTSKVVEGKGRGGAPYVSS